MFSITFTWASHFENILKHPCQLWATKCDALCKGPINPTHIFWVRGRKKIWHYQMWLISIFKCNWAELILLHFFSNSSGIWYFWILHLLVKTLKNCCNNKFFYSMLATKLQCTVAYAYSMVQQVNNRTWLCTYWPYTQHIL